MTDTQLLEYQRRLQRQHGIEPQEPQSNAADVAAGLINLVASKAAAAADPETEYLDETTGLLRCRICGGPRQTKITPPFDDRPPTIVRCWCKCPTNYEKQKQQEKLDEIARRRAVCFRGTDMATWNFGNDNRKRPQLTDAGKRYAEQFREHLKDNNGLLFYGPVGTGKSYMAACIANAVIDQGYKVRMTNFATIANDMQSTWEKAAYIKDLCNNYDLLVLDDLGAERKNEFMQEIVFNVIDTRSRAGLPMIVTTNLSQQELGKPGDMAYKRIYSRVLENCLAINVDGNDQRMQAAGEKKNRLRAQLGMEV